MTANDRWPEETPAYVATDRGDLLTIETLPNGPPTGLTAVMLMSPPWASAMKRNRVWTRLAHTLAARGHRVVRFDWQGVGDSTGVLARPSLDDVYVAESGRVIDWALSRGEGPLAVIGTCFGARAAIAVAVARPEVKAVVSLTAPIFNAGPSGAGRLGDGLVPYLRQWLSPESLVQLRDPLRRKVFVQGVRKRMHRNAVPDLPPGAKATGRRLTFLDQLAMLSDRGVPTLLVHGEQDDLSESFRAAMDGELGALVRDPTSTMELKMLPGAVHKMETVAVQEELIATTALWLDHLALPSPARTGHAEE